MNSRRVTANLPPDLLDQACEASGLGITETLTLGLQLVRRTGALDKARALRGKLVLSVDLEGSRERARR